MGAWGTAIFADDTGADTRDAFTDLIAEGLTAPQATKRLVADFADVLADEEDAIVFWLALAATQWKLGRVVDRVRQRAIRIIDSGSDLRRWQDGPKADANQRKKQLAKLRDQLLRPPPKPRTPKPLPKSSTNFRPGDVATFRLDEHTSVRFCVLDCRGDRGGTYARICLLGLDDERPFRKTTLKLADTLGTHFTMMSHEPNDSITILRRGVKLPERDTKALRAWNNLPVNGHASTWKSFPLALRTVLKQLGWL